MRRLRLSGSSGIVKLRLTAVSDPQHGGFTADSSPVSWGSLDELFVNLTVSIIPLPARGRSVTLVGAGGWWPDPQLD